MPADLDRTAQSVIEHFAMAPHPEGGWYKETYRAPAAPGTRAPVSAIYFLLEKGQRSRWHSVDACEIWLWHAGAPLLLHLAAAGEQVETIRLGTDSAEGERPQAVAAEGVWQAAETLGAWSLVSCIVAPAFEFRGFTLAPPAWVPGPAG